MADLQPSREAATAADVLDRFLPSMSPAMLNTDSAATIDKAISLEAVAARDHEHKRLGVEISLVFIFELEVGREGPCPRAASWRQHFFKV